MDLPSLVSELHLRGLDRDRVDSALRCLVHVYAVQESAPSDVAGILAEDIINTYDLSVVQAASEIFLEKNMVEGREVFRVRWGCEDTAKTMKTELWDHTSRRWEEFVGQLDERYLGFFLPGRGEGARVVSNWKLGRELRWFSIEVPRQGWKILAMMDDISEVALKLDLAFGYRPFGSKGVLGPRVLLHDRAYEVLDARKFPPPEEELRTVRLWKFFSEYDAQATDFVALMKESGLTLEEITDQLKKFSDLGLTSEYRDGQYPPYTVNDKKRKEFQAAVKDLLRPMDAWLSHGGPALEVPSYTPESGIAEAGSFG